MSLHLLARPERTRILLLPLKEGHPVFQGFLRLKETPKGPRPYKFLVKKDAERYLPPEDAIRLLRKAKGIFLAEGDLGMEKEFLALLAAYQLGYRRISVCPHCLGKMLVTPLDEGAVVYKGVHICQACAWEELSREAEFRGFGRSAKNHLARLLRKRRNLDDILALLTLRRVDPDLTRFDVIPASVQDIGMELEDLELPSPLKDMLRQRLERLLPVQALSVSAGLLSGTSQLVVSATATGKSLVGEMAGVKNSLEGRGKLLFLVPLVALANQKFDQLSVYSSLGLSQSLKVGVSRIKLGPARRIRQDLSSDIVVGTYEGIDQAIRTRKALGKVATVVIDEVHMLEDRERGHRLAGLIARLKLVAPEAQFIFLSATVGNPAALAESLGATLVEYNVRPVPIERHLVFTAEHEKRHLMRQLCKKAWSSSSSTGYRGQTIIFTNSRKSCFSLAEAIPGARAYHAGLSYSERKVIEDLFSQGKIEVVVTTAALAAGVDFPASQVIFESLAMGIDWLTVHEFNQMLGRAGRPGYQDRGLVYILAEPGRRYVGGTESEDEVALRLLHGMMEDVAPLYEDEQQLEEVLANAAVARSRDELERLHHLTPGLSPLEPALKRLSQVGLLKGLEPTSLGWAAAAHFLSPVQVETIRKALNEGAPPEEAAVALEHFDALYLKAAERISMALKMPISERVFHGSFLDLLGSAELRSLDKKIQEQCLNFAKDFLRCTCKEAPYCGCVERKVSLRILELRVLGASPSEIVAELEGRYGIYAYPGDLINYLDQIVRYLEGVEALASVLGHKDQAKAAIEQRKLLEGE